MPNDFKLDPNERLVIAGFRGDGAALRCKQELEALGLEDIQLDHVEPVLGAEWDSGISNSLIGGFTDFGSTTPDAVGLADSASSVGSDVVLAFLVKEEELDRVESILKQHGALY